MPSQALKDLLSKMWTDYCELNPAARRIYDLLTAEGEVVLNDHIALRTFNHPRLGIESLAKHIKGLGYKEAPTPYVFAEKKLFAKHYEHTDETQPKIFISELELEKVSPAIQQAVEKMVSEIPQSLIDSPAFLVCGRPWSMSKATYEGLAKESEYASWVAAHGFRPNHFTVNINALKKLHEIRDLNAFLKSKGYTLNAAGGEIKGSKEVYLEQSSTMAAEIEVKFDDGSLKIPGCYYEFAKRYALPNGKLYQGFVAASADKIFESTNQR